MPFFGSDWVDDGREPTATGLEYKLKEAQDETIRLRQVMFTIADEIDKDLSTTVTCSQGVGRARFSPSLAPPSVRQYLRDVMERLRTHALRN
jgi:hypothetical protein